jgi:pimeloyl-ACP methyl ester carboxylesterase
MKKWLLGSIVVVVGLVVLVLAAFRWEAGRRESASAKSAAPPGGRYVKAADVEIFVQEAGPADGVPVLFIHGTGAWSEAWRGPMRALAGAGMRAIAIDLPPFGFSQRPDTPRYSKADQGRRIVGVLDALQLRQAILVGHSFGGGPTMEAALLAPERVRALVLVDAALAISSDDAQAREAPLALRAFLAAQPVRDSVVATFLTNPMFTRKLLQGFIDDPARATDDWVRLYQRPLVVADTTAAVGTWLPALLAPQSVSASERPASYRNLKTATFVIWGERDTITPLDQGERIAKLVPAAELAVMKNVGHIPQIEDPAGFNDLLLKALAKASLASSSR